MFKKTLFLFTITAILLSTIVLLLLKSGLVFVRFPPLGASHQTTPVETKVLNDGLEEFRHNPKMESINSKESLDEDKFGKPVSSEIIGVGYPSKAEGIGKKGTIYTIAYATKTDKTEIAEFFEWVVTNEGELILINYYYLPMKQSYRNTIENRKALNEKYSNCTTIWLGDFLGPLEIRY